MLDRKVRRQLAAHAAALVTLITLTTLTRGAHAQQVFEEVKAVGREVMTTMLWLSSVVAACGFMAVGHAFSTGRIERGKVLLRGTLIGTTCIFSAAGIVQFIKAKFAQPNF